MRMALIGVVIENGGVILRGRYPQLSVYLRLNLWSHFAARCVTEIKADVNRYEARTSTFVVSVLQDPRHHVGGKLVHHTLLERLLIYIVDH